MAGKGFYTKVLIWLMVFCTTAFACNDGFFNCSGRGTEVEQTPALGYNMPTVNSYDTESYTRSRATRMDDPSDTHSFFVSNCLNAEVDCGGGAHRGAFGLTGDGLRGLLLVKDNNTPPGFRSIILGTQSTSYCAHDPSTCEAPFNAGVGQASVVFTGGSYAYDGYNNGANGKGVLWDMHTDTKLYKIQYPSTGRVDSATRTVEYDFNTSCPQLPSTTTYRVSSFHTDRASRMKSTTVSKSSGATTTSRYVVVLDHDPGTGVYTCHVLKTDTLVISRSGTSWPTGTVTSTTCKATVKEAEISPWEEGAGGIPAQVMIQIASPISGCPTGVKRLLWNVDSMQVTPVTDEGGGGATFGVYTLFGFNDAFMKAGSGNHLYGHPFATPNTSYSAVSGVTDTLANYTWEGTDGEITGATPFMVEGAAEPNATWTQPCQNELCVWSLPSAGNSAPPLSIAATYGHTMITGASPYWETKNGIYVMLGEGLACFGSDNMNQWGLDNLGKHKSGIICVEDH